MLSAGNALVGLKRLSATVESSKTEDTTRSIDWVANETGFARGGSTNASASPVLSLQRSIGIVSSQELAT